PERPLLPGPAGTQTGRRRRSLRPLRRRRPRRRPGAAVRERPGQHHPPAQARRPGCAQRRRPEGAEGTGRRRPELRGVAMALLDADWTPEQIAGMAGLHANPVGGEAPSAKAGQQFARRLAEMGCEVIVPVLIDRADTWSGHPDVKMTNQPHREFLYRMAFELGRHVVGYEVQKVLALVDFFGQQPSPPLAPEEAE